MCNARRSEMHGAHGTMGDIASCSLVAQRTAACLIIQEDGTWPCIAALTPCTAQRLDPADSGWAARYAGNTHAGSWRARL